MIAGPIILFGITAITRTGRRIVMLSLLLSLPLLLFTGPNLLTEFLVVLPYLCEALSKGVFLQRMRAVTLVRSEPILAIIRPFAALGCVMGMLEFRTPFSTLLAVFLWFLIGG